MTVGVWGFGSKHTHTHTRSGVKSVVLSVIHCFGVCICIPVLSCAGGSELYVLQTPFPKTVFMCCYLNHSTLSGLCFVYEIGVLTGYFCPGPVVNKPLPLVNKPYLSFFSQHPTVSLEWRLGHLLTPPPPPPVTWQPSFKSLPLDSPLPLEILSHTDLTFPHLTLQQKKNTLTVAFFSLVKLPSN